MICYNISLYLYQNTNIIVMAYFRYNILISQYEYWKDQIKSHKFQIIQKFQLPNIAGNFILSIISNVLDVLSIKHFKISEIFGLWYRGVWYRDILILNIIQRHNFFQSFASIGRVDLVFTDIILDILLGLDNFAVHLVTGSSIVTRNPFLLQCLHGSVREVVENCLVQGVP